MKIQSHISNYAGRVIVGGRQTQRDNIRNKSIVLHGHVNYRAIRMPYLAPITENISVSVLHPQEVIIYGY